VFYTVHLLRRWLFRRGSSLNFHAGASAMCGRRHGLPTLNNWFVGCDKARKAPLPWERLKSN
jgi:hypothetical protein